jgi:hypothetical protein
MAPFNVMFLIEAESLAEAEAAVGEWVVTPGTTLSSITGSVFSTTAPLTITDGGKVSSGEKLTPPLYVPEGAPTPDTQPVEPEPEPTE